MLRARLLTRETGQISLSLEGKFDGKTLSASKKFKTGGSDLEQSFAYGLAVLLPP